MYKSKLPVKKLRLSDINELAIAVFICKSKKATELATYVSETGGIVLSSMRAKGLSRGAMAVSFGAYTEMNVITTMCQKEISVNFVKDVSNRFEFTKPGNGKGFLIDVEGYMGAKAPFIVNQ